MNKYVLLAYDETAQEEVVIGVFEKEPDISGLRFALRVCQLADDSDVAYRQLLTGIMTVSACKRFVITLKPAKTLLHSLRT